MGTPIRDVEDVENKIIGIIQNNLGDKVVEINAEKGDTLLIDVPIESYLTTLNESINNDNLFVFYGVDSIDTISIGAATKQTVNMFVLAFFSGVNSQDENRKKSFRYSRAFKEIIEKNTALHGNLSQIKVTSIAPSDFQLNENSPLYKIGGIIIEVDLA